MAIPRIAPVYDGVSPSGSTRTEQTTAGHGRCGACGFKPRCLPADLTGPDLTRFEHQVWRYSRPVKAGQIVVHQGDTIDSLYALRVGSVKTYIDGADGTERVMAFRLPGTIIGLAEPYQKQWARSFAALEDSWLCRIPLNAIDDALQRQLIRLMSDCLRREYEAHLTLAMNSSHRKVVSFLLDLSAMFRALGQSPVHLRLPMTYLDVASYLGMRHESLSRTLAQLGKQGLLRKDGKEILIDDLPGLSRLKNDDALPGSGNRLVPRPATGVRISRIGKLQPETNRRTVL